MCMVQCRVVCDTHQILSHLRISISFLLYIISHQPPPNMFFSPLNNLPPAMLNHNHRSATTHFFSTVLVRPVWASA